MNGDGTQLTEAPALCPKCQCLFRNKSWLITIRTGETICYGCAFDAIYQSLTDKQLITKLRHISPLHMMIFVAVIEGYTQEQIAEMVGVCQQRISKIIHDYKNF